MVLSNSLQWLSWFNAKAMNFNDAAIVFIKESDYRIHFWYMSKDDASSVMKNCNLNEKSVLL